MVMTLFVLTQKAEGRNDLSLSFENLMENAYFKEHYTRALVYAIKQDAVKKLGSGLSVETFLEKFDLLADQRDPKNGSLGNLFAQIRNNRHTVTVNDGIYTLTIPDVEQTTTSEKSELTRKFTVTVTFSAAGLQ